MLSRGVIRGKGRNDTIHGKGGSARRAAIGEDEGGLRDGGDTRESRKNHRVSIEKMNKFIRGIMGANLPRISSKKKSPIYRVKLQMK